MKTNTLILLFIVFIGKPFFAQDDDKSFKFGLKAVPSVAWYKPDDTKKFKKEGSVVKFGYGLMTEFKLAGSAWLSTGLQVDKDGGVITFLDTVGYYLNKDGEIFEPKDTTSNAGYTVHKLETRTYKNSYITIPFSLRLRTKEIGMMTYYGQFGFPFSFKLKARADDDARKLNLSTGVFDAPSKNEALDVSKDAGFLNIGLTIGAGAEYNMSGSTSLLFGLSYTQGFLNTVRGDSKHLLTDNIPSTALEQKFFSRNVALTVAILF